MPGTKPGLQGPSVRKAEKMHFRNTVVYRARFCKSSTTMSSYIVFMHPKKWLS
jgi:hypothetical protein